MIKFECINCGWVGEESELDTEKTTYEKYYGVGGLLGGSHSFTYNVCPLCGSDELKEIYVYEDEEEEE